MNEQTNLIERGNDVETAVAATAKSWIPVFSGNAGGVLSQSLNQGFPAATQAKHIADVHPHLWRNILKLHGIPELNSPMAG